VYRNSFKILNWLDLSLRSGLTLFSLFLYFLLAKYGVRDMSFRLSCRLGKEWKVTFALSEVRRWGFSSFGEEFFHFSCKL
jgi:hypothetical protein